MPPQQMFKFVYQIRGSCSTAHVCLPHADAFLDVQGAALEQAASMQEALLRSQAEAAAQLDAESARRAQAEEAVEQYIAAHYASQAAAQVNSFLPFLPNCF